jgi:predicted metal-dependent hydrolase
MTTWIRHPELGTVEVRRERRYKRITLRRQSTDFAILRGPASLSAADIHTFFKDHDGPIKKMIESMDAHYTDLAETYNCNADMSEDEACKWLWQRTLDLAGDLKDRISRITVRNQRSRWGSCNHKGAISLNIKLMRLPEQMRDYVILHELMHLLHPHHGPEFWAAMEACMPGARKVGRVVAGINAPALKEFE